VFFTEPVLRLKDPNSSHNFPNSLQPLNTKRINNIKLHSKSSFRKKQNTTPTAECRIKGKNHLLLFTIPDDAHSLRKAERSSCGKRAVPAQLRQKTNSKCSVLHRIGEAAEVFKYITMAKTTLEAQ